MFKKRDLERAREMASMAKNPRTSLEERTALVEWLAGVPPEERSQAIRSEAELDLVRECESADARKDAIGLARLSQQQTLELQVVSAPSRAKATSNGQQRAFHDKHETADRAAGTVTVAVDPELVRAQARAAAQAGVDAEHRRAARLDLDELALTPRWDGSPGWHRDRDGTPLARKRAPSAFWNEEQRAVRDARAERTVYTERRDEHGVWLAREATSGYGTLDTIAEEVCSPGFDPPDAAAGSLIGKRAAAVAAAVQRAERAKELEQVNRRARELARAEGRLPRKRGRKRRG